MANTRAQKTAQNLSTLTTTGDIAYATTAGTPARLGIGSSAQVLTVASGLPSWAAPVSGGMTLLSTTNLSGASTTISIVGGYKNLQIYLKDFYASSAADIYMLINADGTASNYHQLVLRASSSIQSFVSNSVIGFDIAGYQTGTSQADNFSQVTIFDYDQATTKKAILASGGVINGASTKTSFLNTGTYQGTLAAVTGVTFTASAGTFSAGSVEIYGVK